MKDLYTILPYGEKCCEMNLSEKEEEFFIEMSSAIGNPIRFRIVKYLKTHAGCITGDLVNVLPIAQATTSQHLKVLKKAGWIEGTIDGPATRYCLHQENVERFRDIVRRL